MKFVLTIVLLISFRHLFFKQIDLFYHIIAIIKLYSVTLPSTGNTYHHHGRYKYNNKYITIEMACQVETLQSIIRNQIQRIEEKEREIIAANQTRSDYERHRISELENNKLVIHKF